ncbi:MAG: DUF4404 family protein, partial [Lentisphaeraceae bacterium]|nr:DUF4404 family protein [Lentisphaeraceae bacterium]
MINDKLNNIEDKIRNASAMSEENKESVLELLKELKVEMDEVSPEHASKLSSMSDFAEVGANEVSRENGDKGLLDIALSGVNASVKSFETTHPRLVQVINSICTQLSD